MQGTDWLSVLVLRVNSKRSMIAEEQEILGKMANGTPTISHGVQVCCICGPLTILRHQMRLKFSTQGRFCLRSLGQSRWSVFVVGQHFGGASTGIYTQILEWLSLHRIKMC
jgi:hypothetical protein